MEIFITKDKFQMNEILGTALDQNHKRRQSKSRP